MTFSSPISISSGDGEDSKTRSAADVAVANNEAAAPRIARLKIRVYNAMLALSRLGKEGAEILTANVPYISGPGDARMPPAGHTTKRTRQKYAGNGGGISTQVRPDLDDPSYWLAKLQYLESSRKALSQKRRQRYLRAQESQVATEASRAAAVAAATANSPAEKLQRQQRELQAREEARAERIRLAQFKLLWRERRQRIDRWVQTLVPPDLKRCADGGFVWLLAGVPSHPAPIAVELGNIASQTVDPADLSESSVTEMTPVQFFSARRKQPQERAQEQNLQQEQQDEIEEGYQEHNYEFKDHDEQEREGDVYGDSENIDSRDLEHSRDSHLLHMTVGEATEVVLERYEPASNKMLDRQTEKVEVGETTATVTAIKESEFRDKQKSEQQLVHPAAFKAPFAATTLTASTISAPLTVATVPTLAVETLITSVSIGGGAQTKNCTTSKSPTDQNQQAGGGGGGLTHSNPTVLGKRQRRDTNVETAVGVV
ncbi:hypothetical protein SEPCBS57363_003231 [Sporothrix epigloea]|uniref:Uncharacterized protein n=1 Tax=Sporothrix epigloea TaxID=1892477 RepID=A0ABP0DMB2_9PEZI